MDLVVKRGCIKRSLFVVTKIKKGELTYYHRSPASSSSRHCFISLCQRALTGRTVTGRTVAELEVHTKKFYSPVERKEISSTSLDLTKSPRNLALSSVSSTSLTPESHIWTHIWKILPPCANTETSSPVTWGAKDWRQIFKEGSTRCWATVGWDTKPLTIIML